MTKNDKIHAIIHSSAATTAAIGAGLAQIPGSDNLVIKPIQIAMIGSIGKLHGKKMSDASAVALLSALTATVVGRTASQWLVGWIPGYGNAINATTAFTITETIGWAAHAYFREEQAVTEELAATLLQSRHD